MAILGWKYHQHHCFRQQGKSKVGEHSFYREHDIQLSEHYSPYDQENYLLWAPTQQHEQGKWPSFEPVLETNGGILPSRMCYFITTNTTSSLPHLPFLTCTICCFWTAWIQKMEEGRFPKYVDSYVYSSVNLNVSKFNKKCNCSLMNNICW